jgi:transcriptional regulator with XRE-family HTH domain
MKEVRRIREERGLSQARLSELSGVDPAGVSLIETGRRSPGVDTLQKLADALGVEVADFFPRSQPDLFTGTTPPLDFVYMVRANPEQRRRALEAGTDAEKREYRQAIDRQIDSLAKWQAGEGGRVEQHQAALVKQVEFYEELRNEIDPFDGLQPLSDPDTQVGLGAEASLAS